VLLQLVHGRPGPLLNAGPRSKRRIHIIEDLLEKKNHEDLKKAAEYRNVGRTVRRGCHKPAPQADKLNQ